MLILSSPSQTTTIPVSSKNEGNISFQRPGKKKSSIQGENDKEADKRMKLTNM